jgi:hypothetical protein
MYRLLLIYRSLLISAALLVAGCATHAPETAAQDDYAARDAAKCQSHGLQPGNPEYDKCLTQLADKRAQAEADSRAALGDRLLGKPPSWTTQ